MTETLTPGARVAHFRVVRELGRGGFGIVHLAEDLEIPGRLVALKSVRPGPVTPDAEVLRHEASALAALQHPNILVVHEIGEGPSGIFLAAEYMPGGSVAQRIAHEPLAAARALALARGAADALAAAHQAGLIHRDFKPGNLLLAADGLAKVADFGIAVRETGTAPVAHAATPKAPGASDVTVTVIDGHLIAGTPAYMPPEIFSGAPWSARGDQFSFGIVLHEMLTAEHPFDLTLELAATRQIPALSPALPADVKRIVARCLASDPTERYPDMRAVVAALDEAIRRRSPERRLTWRVAGAGLAAVVLLLAAWLGWQIVSERRAMALNEEGRAAFERRDHDAARAAFVAAHSADPGYLPACTNVGALALDEASPAWAVTILRDCAATFPDAAVIRYNLGATLARSGDSSAAAAELTRALELSPDAALRRYVVNELALTRLAQGDAAEAIRLVEAERPDPRASLEQALLSRTLGLALLAAGRAEEAERALRGALTGPVSAEKRTETLEALGRALEALGLREEAVKSFSQALLEGATGKTAEAARAGLARIVPP
jgi:eukaryotic-like serine/threonine-protein kinase